METITLPLPDSKLSPNARLHWAQKSKLVKAHRARSGYEVFDNHLTFIEIKSYRLHFFWKDKRRRDKDNASACCKAYLDGISDAIGQDDSEWEFDGVRFELDRENPRLEIRVETF